jgi:hypothetical protein
MVVYCNSERIRLLLMKWTKFVSVSLAWIRPKMWQIQLLGRFLRANLYYSLVLRACEVDWTGTRSLPLMGFGISVVEPSVSITRKVVSVNHDNTAILSVCVYNNMCCSLHSELMLPILVIFVVDRAWLNYLWCTTHFCCLQVVTSFFMLLITK